MILQKVYGFCQYLNIFGFVFISIYIHTYSMKKHLCCLHEFFIILEKSCKICFYITVVLFMHGSFINYHAEAFVGSKT